MGIQSINIVNTWELLWITSKNLEIRKWKTDQKELNYEIKTYLVRLSNMSLKTINMTQIRFCLVSGLDTLKVGF